MNVEESRNEILKRMRMIKRNRLKRMMNALTVCLVLSVGGLILSLDSVAGIDPDTWNLSLGSLMLTSKSGLSMLAIILGIISLLILACMLFISYRLRKNSDSL